MPTSCPACGGIDPDCATCELMDAHQTKVTGSKPYRMECCCGRVNRTDTKTAAQAIATAHQADPDRLVLVVKWSGEYHVVCAIAHEWQTSVSTPEAAERIRHHHETVFHKETPA